MSRSDLEWVAELERQNFSHPWTLADLRRYREAEDRIYLTAEEDGAVAGYCIVWCSFESADLCRIVTDAAFRKRGLAFALLEEVKRHCVQRGVENILLEVRASNRPALSLYQKSGFEQIAVRRNYYTEPSEDALVMRWEAACSAGEKMFSNDFRYTNKTDLSIL